MKTEDCAIYLDYVILRQIIPASNSPPKFDNFVLKENEAILHVHLYNTKTGHFRCVNKWLAFIIIRGDSNEVSYSYGYDEERSKILYSSFKLPLQNIFQVTAFKKHAKMLIEEKKTQEASDLLFFLPSTTDCKEKINNFFGNANLHPID